MVGGIPSEVAFGGGTLWTSANFAPEWFQDALSEARRTTQDRNARRREIVFAVCFVESYLFEWVRDEVLDRRDFEQLLRNLNRRYFNSKEGVKDRWKKVLKKLEKDGLIRAVPDFNQKYWRDFVDLVDMRDGLVHALSSRPGTDPHPAGTLAPHPSIGFLDQLQAGWATNVVITLVEHLHHVVGSTTPTWLVKP